MLFEANPKSLILDLLLLLLLLLFFFLFFIFIFSYLHHQNHHSGSRFLYDDLPSPLEPNGLLPSPALRQRLLDLHRRTLQPWREKSGRNRGEFIDCAEMVATQQKPHRVGPFGSLSGCWPTIGFFLFYIPKQTHLECVCFWEFWGMFEKNTQPGHQNSTFHGSLNQPILGWINQAANLW